MKVTAPPDVNIYHKASLVEIYYKASLVKRVMEWNRMSRNWPRHTWDQLGKDGPFTSWWWDYWV